MECHHLLIYTLLGAATVTKTHINADHLSVDEQGCHCFGIANVKQRPVLSDISIGLDGHSIACQMHIGRV